MEIVVTVKEAVDDMAKDLKVEEIGRTLLEQGFKVYGMSRLVPGEVTMTYLDEATWNTRQEQLHEACRNSAGFLVEPPDRSPAKLKINKLAYDYRVLIGRVTGVTQPHEQPTNRPGYAHLLWMLEQIQKAPALSLTKRHRWLGYVQGVLIERGITTLQAERDSTRGVLNGA